MQVNGKEFKQTTEKVIGEVLQALQINPEVVVVEQNGNIIMKKNFMSTPVTDEDVLEVVSFVGGG